MLIDSHCHIDFACFDHDRAQLLSQCIATGIDKLVVPGTEASRWPALLALSQQYPLIHTALGLHPYFLANYQPDHLSLLADLLEQHAGRLVAVGEIGLDFDIDVPPALQIEVFSEQIELAKAHQLPLIVHHRRSHNELIRIIKQRNFHFGGIIHAFSGSLQQAHSYLALGFKLGIGGVITYPRAVKTRAVVSQLPLDALVLETDAPDMPPHGKQGQRNTPLNLPLIVDALCSLRDEDATTIIRQCRLNLLACLKNLD